MKKLGVITTVVALLAIASSGVAQAHVIGNHIRPHQLFMGLVNGRPGIVTPVVIKVVCPGPATARPDRASGAPARPSRSSRRRPSTATTVTPATTT